MVFQIEGLHGSKHWNITVTAFETWIHSCSQELEIEINNENGVVTMILQENELDRDKCFVS